MSYDNRSGGKMHSTVDDEVHVTPDFDGEEYGLSGEKTDVDEKVGDGLGGESYQVTAPDLSYVEDVDIARYFSAVCPRYYKADFDCSTCQRPECHKAGLSRCCGLR